MFYITNLRWGWGWGCRRTSLTIGVKLVLYVNFHKEVKIEVNFLRYKFKNSYKLILICQSHATTMWEYAILLTIIVCITNCDFK